MANHAHIKSFVALSIVALTLFLTLSSASTQEGIASEDVFGHLIDVEHGFFYFDLQTTADSGFIRIGRRTITSIDTYGLYGETWKYDVKVQLNNDDSVAMYFLFPSDTIFFTGHHFHSTKSEPFEQVDGVLTSGQPRHFRGYLQWYPRF